MDENGVQEGEMLVELETDKVNIEIVSETSGLLVQISFGEGHRVEVGQVIASLRE